MKHQQTAKEKELADNAYLLRTWKRWHREQLEAALAGLHRDVMGRLMVKLKDLRSARELVVAIEAEDWTAVDADTRLIALHQINSAITKLREKQNLAPIDDALPGEPLRAFQLIRNIIDNQFFATAEKPRPATAHHRTISETGGQL
jgi:hypothetical protein